MNELYFEAREVSDFLDDAKLDMFLKRLPEERAARIRSPRDRKLRAARAAAEAAFRHACNRAGECYADLCIGYTETGKPYIKGRGDLAVSFSHTAALGGALLVKSGGGTAPAVGLDMVSAGEYPANPAAIAARFFPQEEREAWERTDPAHKEAEFLRAWCRIEARVKMTGAGLCAARDAGLPAATDLREWELTDGGGIRHFVCAAVGQGQPG